MPEIMDVLDQSTTAVQTPPPEGAQSDAPTKTEIATEAYALFCARGYEHGHDVEDWLAAEELLRHRRVTEN